MRCQICNGEIGKFEAYQYLVTVGTVHTGCAEIARQEAQQRREWEKQEKHKRKEMHSER